MKLLTLTGLAVALALPLGAAGQRGAVAGCDPLGDVRFICNQVAPEDLALVPGGQWLISSGMAANGAIRLIDLRDKTTTAIFPTATPKERWDKKTTPRVPVRSIRRNRPLSERTGCTCATAETAPTRCSSFTTGIGSQSRSSSSTPKRSHQR